MGINIPAGQPRSIIGRFSGFAIRHHTSAVQLISAAIQQFDKRATDPY